MIEEDASNGGDGMCEGVGVHCRTGSAVEVETCGGPYVPETGPLLAEGGWEATAAEGNWIKQGASLPLRGWGATYTIISSSSFMSSSSVRVSQFSARMGLVGSCERCSGGSLVSTQTPLNRSSTVVIVAWPSAFSAPTLVVFFNETAAAPSRPSTSFIILPKSVKSISRSSSTSEGDSNELGAPLPWKIRKTRSAVGTRPTSCSPEGNKTINRIN